MSRGPRSLLLLCLTAAATLAAAGPFAPDHPLAEGMTERQRIALESIALQPEALHPALLLVASRDALLVRIPALWSDFDVSLGPLLFEYDEDERAALQDLLHYPGLLDLLLAAEGDEAALQQGLVEYPESIHELARLAVRDHASLLRGVGDQMNVAVLAFERMIAALPAAEQDAFRVVAANPALLSLLLEHLDVAQQLAGAARLDREATLRGLAGLHAEVARRRAEAEAQAEGMRRALAAKQQVRAAREEQRRQERAARRLYWGRYPYWGSHSCWYGDPFYDPYWSIGRRQCWYPWYGYRRRHWW